ncbi:SDR family NAD(P)-dependent oxidoreductase [Amycolatopsis acididurans]|uniref:SDR family NAD(P)-dependent oxidoreductase n=1 Tax=Amycolatopsis acididurans TaxID=2724524 RepID=UPI0028B10A8C|nr:SDR family oxidoreductase [Amycolatopsis acididurans]
MTSVGQRLAGKAAIVVGAGQLPGATVGNGRAAAVLYAREGAKVVAADRDLAAAEDTVKEITAAGGDAIAVRADVTSEDDLVAMVRACVGQWGRVDVLHNNVGVARAAGDAPVTEIEAGAFARIMAINLEGMVLACKHVLPVMRDQGAGVITNIASNAVLTDYPTVGYRTSKAGVVSLTEHLAIRNAEYGIRANTILPGLMETPMAVEVKVGQGGATRDDIVAQRNARVPLRRRGGSAWDVANAALFLASEEASFITGTALVVDGGQHLVAG